MKKFLAGTTALVAAAVVAGQAQAADPIKLSVGGFMTQYVAFINHDDLANNGSSYADVLNASNTEIYFRGSTKLDNGLTVAVTMDLEADREPTASANGTDDVFMSVSSDTLGKVELGATKDVVYKMSTSSPAGTSDNDFQVYFSNLRTGDDDVMGESGLDGQKVNYVSPSIAGFQLGLTYGLQYVGNLDDVEPVNTATTGHDYIGAASLAYKGEIAGVSVGADLGHIKVFRGGPVGSTAENSFTTRGGLSAGMAGFKVGGAYSLTNDMGGTQGLEVEAWEAGVSYVTGPYTLSAGYMEIDQNNAGTANDEENAVWTLGVRYDLGAGVSALAQVWNVSDDNNGTANDLDAFGVVTGISASF